MQFEICPINEPHEAIRLELGTPVRFGLSRDSDFQIFGRQALLTALTAQVWVRGSLCYVRNLTNGPDLVRIDEHSVTGTETISGDCTLQVGDSRFQVRVVVSEQATEDLPEQPIGHKFNIEEYNKTIQEWTPQDPRWEMRDGLEKLSKESPLFLMANFKLAGMVAPESAVIGSDLFEEMPDEVRSIYSLHALHACSFEASFEFFQTLSATDAALWVIPRVAPEEAISAGKIFLAWFARPSVMKMTLKEGSSGFCEPLMKCFTGFVVADEASPAGWTILAGSDFDPTSIGER